MPEAGWPTLETVRSWLRGIWSVVGARHGYADAVSTHRRPTTSRIPVLISHTHTQHPAFLRAASRDSSTHVHGPQRWYCSHRRGHPMKVVRSSPSSPPAHLPVNSPALSHPSPGAWRGIAGRCRLLDPHHGLCLALLRACRDRVLHVLCPGSTIGPLYNHSHVSVAAGGLGAHQYRGPTEAVATHESRGSAASLCVARPNQRPLKQHPSAPPLHHVRGNTSLHHPYVMLTLALLPFLFFFFFHPAMREPRAGRRRGCSPPPKPSANPTSPRNTVRSPH